MSSPSKTEPEQDISLWQVNHTNAYSESRPSISQAPIPSNEIYYPNAPSYVYPQSYNPYGYGPLYPTGSAQVAPGTHQTPPPAVQIQGMSPIDCAAGDPFTLRFSSPANFPMQSWSYAVSFDQNPCAASLTFIGHDTVGHIYALRCPVPHLDYSHVNPVSIYMNVYDDQGSSLLYLFAGNISYDHFRHAHAVGAQADLQRWPIPAQNSNLHAHQINNMTPFAQYPSASYPPYQQQDQSFMYSSRPGPIPHQIQIPESHPALDRGRQPNVPMVGRLKDSRGDSPGLSARRSDFRVTKRYTRTPEPITSRQRTVIVRPDSTEPPLVRASKLRAPRAPREDVQIQAISQHGSRRTALNLQGDLVAIATAWTADERANKRRLVEFERKQEDDVLTVKFKAVTSDTRATGSICVSCIWCEEDDETYITSVDSIYLLQALTASKFTVEEKNRVRRNLEGFKPRTVMKRVKNKKQSDKSEEGLENDLLFEVIMGFSEPKPRNIEKDIKIFTWKILPDALKKVLSKFTADYASVEGYLHPASSGSSDQDSSVSPSDSSASYRAGLSNTSRGGRSTSRTAPATSVGRPTLRVQTSTPESSRASQPPAFRKTSSAPSPQAAKGSREWHTQTRQSTWPAPHGVFETPDSIPQHYQHAGTTSMLPPTTSGGDYDPIFDHTQRSLWDP